MYTLFNIGSRCRNHHGYDGLNLYIPICLYGSPHDPHCVVGEFTYTYMWPE